jgi:hypothetical protein
MDDEGLDTGAYTGDIAGQQGTGDGSTGGINPSWQEYLNEVPQEYHDKIIPAFEKWDRGVQDRFQKVHSQYEPYKQFIDSNIDAQTLQFGVNLLNMIEQNPKLVYDNLGSYYKFNETANSNGSGGQGQTDLETENDPYSEKISNIERQNQIMAAHLLKQQEERQLAEAEAELDRELTELQTKYKAQGGFNEQFVLAMMNNGMDAEEAVKQFYAFRDAEVKKYAQRPLIMGSGGGIPQFNTDVRKMDRQGANNLAIQMLRQAAAEKNQ